MKSPLRGARDSRRLDDATILEVGGAHTARTREIVSRHHVVMSSHTARSCNFAIIRHKVEFAVQTEVAVLHGVELVLTNTPLLWNLLHSPVVTEPEPESYNTSNMWHFYYSLVIDNI